VKKNAWTVLGTVCVLVIGVYARAAHSGTLESLSVNAADTYYNLLVRGFQAGQLSLKKEVPVGLTQLADPYDPTANILYRRGPSRLEDLSYYKGKLYLYFGITPAVILFWPFAALTGHYLFHGQAVPILCSVGFLTSVGVLAALWRRYFSEVSVWVVLACTLALGLATGVPIMLPRSSVYEVAISCGYMLTMLALGAIWKTLHEPERGGWYLTTASLAYGLAVGARPSLVLGAVILLVPVIQAWREHRNILTLLLAATGPIMCIGLGLMLYNALRFDSPLEFGWHYELGGERQFARSMFGLRHLWFNFLVYFWEPVCWRSRFPFVGEITVPPVPVGYGQVENPFGVLTNIPLVWLALAAPLACGGRSGRAASALRWFVAAVALLFATTALPILFFFSAIVRYEVEFLPALLLLAVVGILGLERSLADQPGWRRVARWGWGLLLGFSVAFNLFASVGYYAKAYANLGGVSLHTGKLQEAIGYYEQALRINPHFAAAHKGLGVALARTGNQSEAAWHYEEALRFKPDDAETHSYLGLALKRLGKIPEATWQYEEALRIDPNYLEAGNNLAWLLATQAPAEGGDPVRAVALAERTCKATDNRVASYLDTLAAGYAAAGRFDDAIGTAQKAVELAHSGNQSNLVKKIEGRVQLYRAGRAYYQSTDATTLPNAP
jgi:tetratricopeptide (TPR) repeat protein